METSSPGERPQQCLGTDQGPDRAVAEFQPGASYKCPRESVEDLTGLRHYTVV